MAEHKKQWCSHCRYWMIVCGTCGNNTCNAGYGTVGGETCPDCPSAYEVFDRLEDEPPPPGEHGPIEPEEES